MKDRTEAIIRKYGDSCQVLLLFRVDTHKFASDQQICLYPALLADSTLPDQDVLHGLRKDNSLDQFEPTEISHTFMQTQIVPFVMNETVRLKTHEPNHDFTLGDTLISIKEFEQEILRLLCQHVFPTSSMAQLASIQLTNGHHLQDIPIRVYRRAGILGLNRFMIIGLWQPETDHCNPNLTDALFSWFAKHAEQTIKEMLATTKHVMLSGIFGPKR